MSVCIEYECFENTKESVFQGTVKKVAAQNAVAQSNEYPVSRAPQSLIFSYFVLWKNRIKQRKELSQLDDRILADIGYSAEEAQAEYRKPFWK